MLHAERRRTKSYILHKNKRKKKGWGNRKTEMKRKKQEEDNLKTTKKRKHKKNDFLNEDVGWWEEENHMEAKWEMEEDDAREIRRDWGINYVSKYRNKGEKGKMRVCSRECVCDTGGCQADSCEAGVSLCLTHRGGGGLFFL